jgi:xanthine dehydrogenase accessory factor
VKLDAARAAEISLEAVEAGAGTATLLLVSGEAAGGRLLLVVAPDGTETVHGTLGSPVLDDAGVGVARAAVDDPRHRDGLHALTPEHEAYLEVRRPVPDLVIVGAGHIARPMCRVGDDLGFRVWVLDDRPDFATRERFPDAHAVVQGDFSDPFRDIPIHERTHFLLVTRGHKYDYDCLVRILRADPAPAYIGMIGSRRRVRATFVQLLEEGFPVERLHDIHAPVGLDVGAETPEEIAVAVAAELVLVRRGGTGTPLRDKERVAERFFGNMEEA